MSAFFVRVEALATFGLVAVSRYHIATFHGSGTTVATIVVTFCVIVLVVAIAVSFISACFFAVRIEALAPCVLVAVILVHNATFHGSGTTVATIVVTFCVIVHVVAIAVSFISAFFVGVEALATFGCVAVSRYHIATFHGSGTTVATIVVTFYVIVHVVAKAVS